MNTLAICLLGLGLLAPVDAAAQEVPAAEQQARALYEQGLRFYNEQDYASAVRLWQQAHALNPRPAILHNIAKAHEDAGDLDQALATWQQYRTVAPPDQVASTDAKIVALQAAVAALQARAAPPDPGETAAVQLPPPIAASPKERRSPRGVVAGLLGTAAVGAVAGGAVLSNGARVAGGSLAQGGCVRTADGTTLCDGPTVDGLSSSRLQFGLGMVLVGGGLALGTGSVLVAVRPSSRLGDVSLALEGSW